MEKYLRFYYKEEEPIAVIITPEVELLTIEQVLDKIIKMSNDSKHLAMKIKAAGKCKVEGLDEPIYIFSTKVNQLPFIEQYTLNDNIISDNTCLLANLTIEPNVEGDGK